MSVHPRTHPVTRRTALAGLGAAGLGLALTTRPVAGQDAAAELAAHPVVGLWQAIAPLGPDLPASPTFELYHADGTYTTWSGWDLGAALGIWRPTGARTAEVLYIWVDTSPFPTAQDQRPQAGTATFTFQLEVDAADTTLVYTDGTMDLRDAAGTHLGAPASFVGRSATRVTFDVNPATGSTVVAPPASPGASPTAGQVVDVELGEYYIEPAETTYMVGEPYTFVVTNAGTMVHEFVIEPAGAVDQPLEEGDVESEIEDIGPGATKELAWTFTEAGAYQFACHIAGHYEQGMVVEVTVEA